MFRFCILLHDIELPHSKEHCNINKEKNKNNNTNSNNNNKTQKRLNKTKYSYNNKKQHTEMHIKNTYIYNLIVYGTETRVFNKNSQQYDQPY